MTWRLGIDVGGTFSDLALIDDATGQLLVHKVDTEPDDIASGCLKGIATLLSDTGIDPADVGFWSHGSTVATNAIVQRRGARTALVTTQGFRDVIELRRQVKPDRYDLRVLKPDPLVGRELRLEVRERILAGGSVHVPLDDAEVHRLIAVLGEAGVEAVSICFLHSYANPSHEQRVADAIRAKLPGVYVCSSFEVVPEFREFERFSTTVINAYVGPLMSGYLSRFSEGGRKLGLRSDLNVFQSNGGVNSAAGASSRPVSVLFSGPSAAVAGAAFLGMQAGHPDLITFDMGGTSCDVCLIRGGQPTTTPQIEVEGLPVRARMVDIHAVGAGGGSIASVDRGGFLQVGPHSAGARPGPACYGRGGDQATVTDANVLLGRLHPKFLLGGHLPISIDRSEAVVSAVGRGLGVGTVEAAAGIVEIVNSNMVRAIRVVSVDRGHDPRDFVLMAGGGAGPLHAAEVARQLGIKRVLVPPTPGILSALGLLVADYRLDFTRTFMRDLDAGLLPELASAFDELEARARKGVADNGIPGGASARASRHLQMRYAGQSYEFEIPVPEALGTARAFDEIAAGFHAVHERAYGYASPDARLQSVGLHLALTISVPRPQLKRPGPKDPAGARRDAEHRDLEHRDVYFRSEMRFIQSRVYQRSDLAPGDDLVGPAIVDQFDSTTLVLPDQRATVDDLGNLHLVDR